MRINLSIILTTLIALSTHAQLLDLVRLEYTTVPGSNSNFDYQRKRVLFNLPIKVKEDAYFFAGIDYSSIDLNFSETISSFDQDKTDQFRLLDLNLTYTFKVHDWRFAARLIPGFSSNLEEGGLLFDDTVLSGVIAFVKDKKQNSDKAKPYRIILGMAYSGNGGIPFPIPFVSFYKKFHPKWSYNIGVPTSNLQFHASDKVRFKVFSTLDGFNSNLQDGLVVDGTRTAEQIRMSLILLGLRYEYNLAKNVEMFVNTTRTLNPRVQLRSGRKNIFALDQQGAYHFRGGIRLKI